MAFCAAPLSLGRIVSGVIIGRVTQFIPRERSNANTRYCQLFKATTAYTSACTDAGAAWAPLLSGGTRVCDWQSTHRLEPDTRRLQLPLDDCFRPVLPYNAVAAFNRRNRSLMTLPRWGRKVLLLALDQCSRTMPYTAFDRWNRSLMTLPGWGKKYHYKQ